MKKVIGIILYISILITPVYAINIDTAVILKDMGSKSNDVRFNALNNYALYLYHVNGYNHLADSISYATVLECLLNQNEHCYIHSTIIYSQVCKPIHHEKALENLQKALKIAINNNDEQSQFLIYLNLAKINQQLELFDDAKKNCEKALKYFLNQKKNNVFYYLCLGDLHFRINNKMDAFENYQNALLKSTEIADDSLIVECKYKMADFFNDLNEGLKNKENISAIGELIKKNKRFNEYDNYKYQGALIISYLEIGEESLAQSLLDKIYPTLIKNQFYTISNAIFSNLRRHYFSNNKRQEICDLYCNEVKYPNELERLKITDLKLYYRVKAIIAENKEQIDSANYYFQLAETHTYKDYNVAGLAMFYKRKAEFYIRQNDMKSALKSYEKYYEYAHHSLYLPYIIDAAHILDSLHFLQNNISAAYKYQKVKNLYADSNALNNSKDKIFLTELNYKTKINDIILSEKQLLDKKKTDLQVIVIFTLIILFLIFIIIFSRYRLSLKILKLFSYLTFILLFEFMIYLLDNIIHKWAHGQPIQIIAIKVIIIAIILPIHNAVDYRVFKYLTKKQLVNENNSSFLKTLQNGWQSFSKWVNIERDIEKEAELNNHASLQDTSNTEQKPNIEQGKV